MADVNNINFVFDADQPSNNNNGFNYHTAANTAYQDDGMLAEENANEANYEDEEISRKEYWQEYELDFTPNIIRWIKSNYTPHMKGAQDTVLIAGYNHCNEYYLQTVNYGKSEANQQRIEVTADDKITLCSEIADIQFADDQTAVIVTRNGEIKLIKLQQNDEYSPQNDDDDEKMIVFNNKKPGNKWKLIPIASGHNPNICYPNQQNKHYRAALTSVTVNTNYGNIVASDEGGYIYITDIDQQKFITAQSCSSSAINCIRFTNSNIIVSVSMSGQLMLWDLRRLNNVCYAATVPRKHGSLISLAVHPHTNHLFSTGTEYGSVAIWDIRGKNGNDNDHNHNKQDDDESYKLFSGHRKHTLVNDINFLTNNSNSMNGLVTCGNDGITQIFQSEHNDWKDLSQSAWNTNITTIQEEKYPVSSLDFYEKLSIVATCCDAQKLSFFPI